MESCEVHRCSWVNCHGVTRDDSNYCPRHKCQQKKCRDPIHGEHHGNYCEQHTCIWDSRSDDCVSERVRGSNYCTKHTCVETGCNSAVGRSTWSLCVEHEKLDLEKEELELRRQHLTYLRSTGFPTSPTAGQPFVIQLLKSPHLDSLPPQYDGSRIAEL